NRACSYRSREPGSPKCDFYVTFASALPDPDRNSRLTPMQDITTVLPLLQTPKKIFITTHHRPDGDAMGSSLGLYHYLKNGGHHPVVVSPSEVPDFVLWMPGMEQVLNFETDSKKSMELLEECDLIF